MGSSSIHVTSIRSCAAGKSSRVTAPHGRRQIISELAAVAQQLTNKAAAGELKAVQLLAALVRPAEERAIQAVVTKSGLEEVDEKVVLAILKRLETTSKGEQEG